MREFAAKALAATACAALTVAAVDLVAQEAFRRGAPDEPAYSVEPPQNEPDRQASTGTSASLQPDMPEKGSPETTREGPKSDSAGKGGDGGLAKAVASADPEAGESAIGTCKACHSFNEGGGHRVGPNLHGVMGAEVAGKEGFNYSGALSRKSGSWTVAKMDAWLKDPDSWAPGNRMTYPGVGDDRTRHDIVAYLASISPEFDLVD